ncbi:choline transporter [Exophiala xenobiotica]|nr:choline transporter [Exophiala xenobiotica]KAK5215547.1 choline transporter [Exophiala xenobiotica]KAK5284877.1 choline transporter [Exophiala xenobiotica]KAK5311840.1 choline transporter [Exophiala xenobiotica]KAK5463803.1 choline transporter [Exophiala xenobiotica]
MGRTSRSSAIPLSSAEPGLERFDTTLWLARTSQSSLAVILITVPAKAPTHQDAKFVFATFIDNTGWSSSGIAFIVGLINPNWGFSCLDTVVHIAKECNHPEKLVPIGIIGTVVIGFITSFTFSISMFFSIGNFEDMVDTATYVPILELFYQALQNKGGAVALEALELRAPIGPRVLETIEDEVVVLAPIGPTLAEGVEIVLALVCATEEELEEY